MRPKYPARSAYPASHPSPPPWPSLSPGAAQFSPGGLKTFGNVRIGRARREFHGEGRGREVLNLLRAVSWPALISLAPSHVTAQE